MITNIEIYRMYGHEINKFICRYDNHKSKHCFKNISEDDKQRQINNYFESHCKDLL